MSELTNTLKDILLTGVSMEHAAKRCCKCHKAVDWLIHREGARICHPCLETHYPEEYAELMRELDALSDDHMDDFSSEIDPSDAYHDSLSEPCK